MKRTMLQLGATILLATGVTAANAQTTEQKTPSAADKPAEQRAGEKQTPKTTGAMDNAVGGVATSAQDVQKQTQGEPTAAEAGKGKTSTNPKPDITKNSPGTVGASPGAQPSGDRKPQ